MSGDALANVQSTVRVDVLAAWADPFDDGRSKQGAVLLDKTSRVDEVPLTLGQSDLIALDKIRHDFGDTCHHEVFYQAIATTRFLEYFTETVRKKLTGTTAVVFSPAGFAPGTVDVRAAGDTATIYTSGVDFTEKDGAGSIARIAGGSIPDGAEVEVQFVAPPVIRSSLEKAAKPPTKFGYLRSIPSTARPPAPEVRYLIPAWNWVTAPSPSAPSSSRVGNVLRVYLGRPWFESGIGELLGVVYSSPPPGHVLPSGLQPFVSGFGSDPMFVTGPVVTPKASVFPLAVHHGTSLQLEEQQGGIGWVGVAGHAVNWDEDRRLWFADISIAAGQSYFPFVKLALVRYQPASLAGVELSRVVQADFIQMTPDRSMGLTYPSASEVAVKVVGPAYLSTTSRTTPDTMRAYLQLKAVETSDPDLQWIIDPAQPNGTLLSVTSLSESDTVWDGTVKLPKAAWHDPLQDPGRRVRGAHRREGGQPRLQGHLSRRHRDLTEPGTSAPRGRRRSTTSRRTRKVVFAMTLRRPGGYKAHSFGCVPVRLIALGIAAGADEQKRRTIRLTCAGWWLGWLSATIARNVHPQARCKEAIAESG